MRISDVDPEFIFEGDVNPQLAQLNKLLANAKAPWEVAQYKWRIQNLQNSIDLDKGVPVDATGNLKPVVDARTWMKQNPSLVKSLPKEALPPEMQQPGILDKISTAVKDIRDYANRDTKLDIQKQQNRDALEYERNDAKFNEMQENLERIVTLSKVLRG